MDNVAMRRIMEEYAAAVDHDVKEFVDDVLAGNDRAGFVTVAFLSEKAAAKINELTGKKAAGNRIVLDASAIRHIENRHGKDGKQDHSMKDTADMARIGYIIMNYDDISFNGETSFNHMDEKGMPAPMVQFSKRIDGTVYVVQTVSEAKSRRNYIVTAYIKKKQPSNP